MTILLQTRRGRFFCLVFITHAKTESVAPFSCRCLSLSHCFGAFRCASPSRRTLCRRPSPLAARNRTRTLHTKKSLGCFADVQNDRALEISAGDCPEGEQLMSAAVRSSNASSCERAGSGKLSVFPLHSVALVPGYLPPGRALDCPTPVELGGRRRRRGDEGPCFFMYHVLLTSLGGAHGLRPFGVWLVKVLLEEVTA